MSQQTGPTFEGSDTHFTFDELNSLDPQLPLERDYLCGDSACFLPSSKDLLVHRSAIPETGERFAFELSATLGNATVGDVVVVSSEPLRAFPNALTWPVLALAHLCDTSRPTM